MGFFQSNDGELDRRRTVAKEEPNPAFVWFKDAQERQMVIV
jgi:hypothetical protein